MADKDEGAFLAIGELALRLGVPAHVLRYWESRFPELKPMQRSGRRRYYRVEDVALAERIHDLLHVRGYTVDGARKVLASKEPIDEGALKRPTPRFDDEAPAAISATISAMALPAAEAAPGWHEPAVPVIELINLRQRLALALAAG
ncbi:MAG: hypothetical protein RLZZ58_127 [Pseudomonadota bacterium]